MKKSEELIMENMDCCHPLKESVAHNMHNKNMHTEHGNMGMSHGSAKGYFQRFLIVGFLLIPLVLTNSAAANFLGIPEFLLNKWIELALSSVIFGFSFVFFQHARHEIMAKKYGMMTLVSLAVGSGFLFSAVSTFIPSLHTEFYLEISTLIWVLLFGHYLEAKSTASASDALSEIAKLLPKRAHKIVNGKEEDVSLEDLKENDIVLIKPGEKIPADGIIISGSSNVNESLVSGESKPIQKKENENVLAGSIVIDGSLTARLQRVGERSTVGQIQKLIEEAKRSKPKTERLADRAAGVLTFLALSAAVSTIIIWYAVLNMPFVFAVTLAITVLVIACPHALGLAIPSVTATATTLAVKNGIFIKNLAKIEIIKKANYVVFDKTGTLTKGKFGVSSTATLADITKEELVSLAASLENHSSHIIGKAIVSYAKNKNIKISEISNFKNFPGKGVRAEILSRAYFAGNKIFMKELNLLDGGAEKIYDDFAGGGKTAVFVADDKNILGVIALSDEIREESKRAVRALHLLGINVAMLTGDNKETAAGVAKDLGIDLYFAEVLPEDKYKHIESLQKKGNVVLMVGDGVNDAPALAKSDVGIVVQSGTDIAAEAGDIVLTRSNPEDVFRLIILSKKVYRKMVQNLFWALGYNALAIPAAAGVFSGLGFYLRPEIGALLMSASTVIVVLNASMLRRVKPEPIS